MTAREYIGRVVENCKAMCDEFIKMGYKIVTGGTDNHLFLLDLTGISCNVIYSSFLISIKSDSFIDLAFLKSN